MRIVKLSDTIAVSEQITPDDVAAIAAAGYRVLVNNRPDGEETGQPASDAIAAAAAAAGLDYIHQPVTAVDFPGAGFDDFCALLDEPARPVLAFCRTGTRCTNLWLSSRPAAEREQAAALARGLGYELDMATRFLASREGTAP